MEVSKYFINKKHCLTYMIPFQVYNTVCRGEICVMSSGKQGLETVYK